MILACLEHQPKPCDIFFSFLFLLKKIHLHGNTQIRFGRRLASNQIWLFLLSLLFLPFQKNDGLRSAGLLPAQHTVHQHVSQHQVWHLNQQHQIPSGRHRPHHAHILSGWVERRQLPRVESLTGVRRSTTITCHPSWSEWHQKMSDLQI